MKDNLHARGPAMRGSAFGGAVAGVEKVGLARRRTDIIEWVIFWGFVAGLAWIPYWYGSNDLIAWGLNAILFPGLALIYELSILLQGKPHAVGLQQVRISAALFVAVVLWILIQNASWTPISWQHPIWGMTANALARPVDGSISVNRDLTSLALLRLITSASAFWVALQLCQNASRAAYLIRALVVISCAYAAYGLIALYAWQSENTISRGFLNSSFFNHNHFATYAGIGFIAACGLIFSIYQREVTLVDGSLQFKIASIIDTTGQKAAFVLAGGFLILVALLLTGSRGGIFATGAGVFVLAVLSFARRKRAAREVSWMVFVGALIVGGVLLAFADTLVFAVNAKGLSDQNRMAVYMVTLRSILDAPLLGYGYGTFADVFPMFRDRSLNVQGIWEQAHDTYLEMFQGLGLLFGSMLVASVALLVRACFIGARTRQQGMMVPCVATAVACLIGLHALVDFSLQMQAVTLTFMAVLGAGVAQSKSSRQPVHRTSGPARQLYK
jgi:O-antigen ligase